METNKSAPRFLLASVTPEIDVFRVWATVSRLNVGAAHEIGASADALAHVRNMAARTSEQTLRRFEVSDSGRVTRLPDATKVDRRTLRRGQFDPLLRDLDVGQSVEINVPPNQYSAVRKAAERIASASDSRMYRCEAGVGGITVTRVQRDVPAERSYESATGYMRAMDVGEEWRVPKPNNMSTLRSTASALRAGGHGAFVVSIGDDMEAIVTRIK